MSAVSTKLIPASSARWMMRMLSSWSFVPQSPNIIAPRHRLLTETTVGPTMRCCMGLLLWVEGWSVAEDGLGDGDGGHRARPAGVEREVDDDLFELLVGQAVLTGAREVSTELFGAAIGDQRRDGDQAAVARGQFGAFPDVTEQGVVGERHHLGQEIADQILRWVLLGFGHE